MTRWEPDTAMRLRAAALELFDTQGFEQTTAADIAREAGVTERTFFRHFADKREVLFLGQDLLTTEFLAGIASAPVGAAPTELVARALEHGAAFFPEERRESSRVRAHVIDANPALAERESQKLASLARDVAAALRERGIPEPAASLAAETVRSVFHLAFQQWIADGEARSISEIEQDLLARLAAFHAG